MAKTDEITAILVGATAPAPNQHQLWLDSNLVAATFMGLPILGGVCSALLPRLRIAEAALLAIGTAQSLGVRSASGYQGGGFHGLHSWGLALDINYVTNPYVMHEAGERALDNQLRQVFQRICHFLIVNNPDHPDSDSIIPQLGRLPHSRTLQQNYLAMRAESDAMIRYFALMEDGAALQQYLNGPIGYQGYLRAFGPDGASLATVSTAPNQSQLPNVPAVQRQMREDWTALTSRPIPGSATLPHAACECEDSELRYQPAPPVHGDRPFDGPGGRRLLEGRTPLAGYFDLSLEVVRALVSPHVGLRWGATDFGPESGDIMHFDAGNLTSLTFASGGAVGDLNHAMSEWNAAHRQQPAPRR
jgi:hypothetical protein